jgi:hypothetical protein
VNGTLGIWDTTQFPTVSSKWGSVGSDQIYLDFCGTSIKRQSRYCKKGLFLWFQKSFNKHLAPHRITEFVDFFHRPVF